MRLPTLFKQNRNKSYNYTPRYYDERKERIENLKKAKAARSEGDFFEANRKKSYREDWRAANSKAQNTNSRNRFLIILGFLFAIAYFVIKNGYIDSLF